VAHATAKRNGCNGRCHAAAATATAVATVYAGCGSSLGNLAGCIECWPPSALLLLLLLLLLQR